VVLALIAQPTPARQCPSPASEVLSFGPNELCTLRQHLSSSANDNLSFDCLSELVSLSGDDWTIFAQFQWQLRAALISLVDTDQVLARTLSLIERMTASFLASAPTSAHEYLHNRWRLLSFVYSLSLCPLLPSLRLHCISSLLFTLPIPRPPPLREGDDDTTDSFHSPSSFCPFSSPLVQSQLFIRTPSLAQHFRLSGDSSVALTLYSPLELFLLWNCFSSIAATAECEQLSSLCAQLLRHPHQTCRSHFTTPSPSQRTKKQDQRRWRKIQRKLLAETGSVVVSVSLEEVEEGGRSESHSA
jgi:hypothetical protein